jgi:hypothetical protein
VFTVLAVSHWIKHQTRWSIKKLVRTARRYRTVTIQAGRQTLTAAESLPDDLAEALTKIGGGGALSLIKVGLYPPGRTPACACGSEVRFHPLNIRHAGRSACSESSRWVQFVQLDQHERLGSDIASA